MMICHKLVKLTGNSYTRLKYCQLFWIITLFKVMFALNTNLDSQTEYKTYPEQHVMTGFSASLPCDITASGVSTTDSVTLILWYKGSDISGAPIYSIDARNTPLESAKHFVSDEYEGRAHFDISVRPSLLKISQVADTDGGQYWCRVDYRWTRTTTSKVPLIVIVPPRRVIIRDQSGSELKSIALFDEGSDVELFCESIGGNPLPTITWFRNNRKLKTQTVMIKDNNTVVSSILLERMERGDINSVLKCNAFNSDLTKAVVKSVTIDLNLRPMKTHIIGLNRERLIAGRRVEAICHTYGSRPPAVVNWFINERLLTEFKDIQTDGNGTKSMVTFIPKPEDNGSHLKCRAENQKLSESAVEDIINLDVKFMPNVTLKVGSATQMVSVYETNEILLECNVTSNPKPTHIRWLFNRKELIQDIAKGIIITNSSLVVKNARQESEGRYQCVAYNSEGRGDSTELFVQVFYAPKCVTQQKVVETSLSYPTNIFCQVKANPENVTFVWESANRDDSRRMTVSSKALRSKLTLIPQTLNDFGIYMCWAHNTVGSNQQNPCIFNVTDSGQSLPKPVNDCRVNATYLSVFIKCSYPQQHPHGSTPQYPEQDIDFHLEVRDSNKKHLIVNLTNSEEPVFNVTNIEWAPIYQIIVYVSNAFGVSNEVTMMVQTEAPAFKSSVRAPPIPSNSQQSTNDMNSSHKILVILISLLTIVLVILSILITITIVLCFLRQKNNRKRNKRAGSEAQDSGHTLDSTFKKNYKNKKNKKLCQTSAKTSDDSIATSEGSVHPDVIPCDGVVFYNNDRDIIDDQMSNNTFNANNALSIYRHIISGATDQHIDQHNDHILVNKNLLTNHSNHVSFINARQNSSEDIVLVQTHHGLSSNAIISKLQNYDNSTNIEANENYLHLNSTYPQTTPV